MPKCMSCQTIFSTSRKSMVKVCLKWLKFLQCPNSSWKIIRITIWNEAFEFYSSNNSYAPKYNNKQFGFFCELLYLILNNVILHHRRNVRRKEIHNPSNLKTLHALSGNYQWSNIKGFTNITLCTIFFGIIRRMHIKAYFIKMSRIRPYAKL